MFKQLNGIWITLSGSLLANITNLGNSTMNRLYSLTYSKSLGLSPSSINSYWDINEYSNEIYFPT